MTNEMATISVAILFYIIIFDYCSFPLCYLIFWTHGALFHANRHYWNLWVSVDLLDQKLLLLLKRMLLYWRLGLVQEIHLQFHLYAVFLLLYNILQVRKKILLHFNDLLLVMPGNFSNRSSNLATLSTS